jgi:hypothetical protein
MRSIDDPPMPTPLDYRPAARGSPRRGLVIFFCVAAVAGLYFALAEVRDAPLPWRVAESAVDGAAAGVLAVGGTSLIRGPAANPVGSSPIPFHTPLRPGLANSWPFYEWLLAHRNATVITVEAEPRDNCYLVNLVFWFVPRLLIFLFLWLLFVRPLQRRLGATPPASS